MAKQHKIYTNTNIPHVDIPQVDLLTLLFDSEHSIAQPDTVLHVDTAHSENTLTKDRLRNLWERIARGLREEFKIGSTGPDKDVVTVLSHGQILVPAVFFGVVAAGGIYSAASPSSTVSELARQIEIGKSRLVICGPEHKDLARQAAKQCGVPASRVLVAESWPSLSLKSLEGGINAISEQRLLWKPITDPQKLKKSIITILWSSGTTGLPKGVQLSHLNLVAETYIINIQNRMYVANLLETDPSSYTPIEYRTLAHLPISHIAGLFGYLIGPQFSGGTVYWMRKYNWTEFLKCMSDYKITAFYTVPSIYLRISKSPEVKDAFKNVVAANTGAAPMDSKLQRASNAKMGDGQSTFIGQTWGLSETTGAVTAIPAGQADTTGCIGFILPNVELRIVDDDWNDVEPGKEGELLIRAPVVMEGYFNNEQATRDAFHDSGDGKGLWFCSGDIGVMRDGKFYVVDRKKELLKYKGLQIAPAEIENLLFTHPAVAEAAVVGVPAPDDPGTDLPRAYIVLSGISAASGMIIPASNTWPTTPALEAQAAEQRVNSQDPSKGDTLSQTRYQDSKSSSNVSQTIGNDSSKQDTLSQTQYTGGKGSPVATPSIQQNGIHDDFSKKDTLSQTQYTDRKPLTASQAEYPEKSSANTWPAAPALEAQAAGQRSAAGDPSKNDALDQTRYNDKTGSGANSEARLIEELQRYVADRLAQHKQLRGGIKFVPEIPKNAIGKFLRRDLRERAKKEILVERGISKAKL